MNDSVWWYLQLLKAVMVAAAVAFLNQFILAENITDPKVWLIGAAAGAAKVAASVAVRWLSAMGSPDPPSDPPSLHPVE